MQHLSRRVNGINPFQVMELLSRAKDLEKQGRDIIHMEIGEPDFLTPQAVIEAGVRNIKSGSIKYTEAAGLKPLRQAISDYYNDRYACTVAAERIFITPGGSGALLLVLASLVDAGDNILIADPGYPCNRNFIRLFDGEARAVQVSAENNFQLNSHVIRENWNDRTRGVLVASPSNPTGTILDRNEFKAVIETTNSYGGILISDEIYHGLEYGCKASSAMEFSDQVCVVNSFSKYFGMTGWRLGWLIVPDTMVEAIEKLAQNIFISAPSHSQFAALASFEDRNIAELENRREEYDQRRQYLYSQLERLGFAIPCKPEGAFYVYAGCEHFSDNGSEMTNRLLEAYGIAVTPGMDFGVNKAEKYLRFAYTTTMESLVEGVRRIERFIA